MSQDAPGRGVNITGQKRQRGREGDDSTGLAAVPPVDGSKKQPGWTLKSTVKEVLLGEHKCLGEMKAGDFLRKHFGDTITIPDVSMTVLVKWPGRYISDGELLNHVGKLEEFQLLRAYNYLIDEGVDDLTRWRAMSTDAIKVYIGLIASRKLDRALEYAILAADEEARLAEAAAVQPEWTLKSTVKEVLLWEHKCLGEMKAGDFLRKHFGDTVTIPDVSMTVFVKWPGQYISDGELLNHVEKLEEFQLLKAYNYLIGEGIVYIKQWDDIKSQIIVDAIGPVAVGRLKGATETAKGLRQRAAQAMDGKLLEGVYESVYNASWGYVESGHVDAPLGMKCLTGKPNLWPKEEVDISHTCKNMGKPLPRKGNLEIAVLTSLVGWPYESFCVGADGNDVNANRDKEAEFEGDVYVRRETLRVWYKVEEGLRQWLMGGGVAKKAAFVLIGTPGIGKSFAAGSLLLYKLLHYESDILQIIIYVVKGEAYVFHKPRGPLPGQVTFYATHKRAFEVVAEETKAAGGRVRGYVIVDVYKEDHAPAAPPAFCSGIVLSSPDEEQFFEWGKRNKAGCLYMNCDTVDDLEAIHVWRWSKILPMCGVTDRKQSVGLVEEEWDIINKRVKVVGPLLRHIITSESYNSRVAAMKNSISELGEHDREHYMALLRDVSGWQTSKPTHKLVQVVRVKVPDVECDSYRCRPLSNYVYEVLLDKVGLLVASDGALTSGLVSNRTAAGLDFEKKGIMTMLHPEALIELAKDLHRLPYAEGQPPDSVLNGLNNPSLSSKMIFFPADAPENPLEVKFMHLYTPLDALFPLVDAFFFVEEPKTFVGLQYTLAKDHHCTTVALLRLKEELRNHFQNWEAFSRTLQWEIIYVQRFDCPAFKRLQRCLANAEMGYGAAELQRFWVDRVRQFSVLLSNQLVALYVDVVTRHNKHMPDGHHEED